MWFKFEEHQVTPLRNDCYHEVIKTIYLAGARTAVEFETPGGFKYLRVQVIYPLINAKQVSQ